MAQMLSWQQRFSFWRDYCWETEDGNRRSVSYACDKKFVKSVHRLEKKSQTIIPSIDLMGEMLQLVGGDPNKLEVDGGIHEISSSFWHRRRSCCD